MSEETKTTLPVTEADEEKSLETKEPTKKFSRREALLGALFGAGVAVAKTAEAAEAACACLAPPDCNSICAHGGTPRGDGTQACDCNPDGLATVAYTGKYSDLSGLPSIPSVPSTARVATTGSYNDLTNKPSIPSSLTLPDITSAGSAGPTSNVTTTIVEYGNTKKITGLEGTKNMKVPYFTVNAQGLITSYATRNYSVSLTTDYYYDNNCGDGYDQTSTPNNC